MKKTLLTLLTCSIFSLAQAQLDPDEIDRLRISIYSEDYDPGGNRGTLDFVKKVESKVNTMNVPKKGCIWKPISPGNVALCCCSKTESRYIEYNFPQVNWFYGMWTPGTTILGPAIDAATPNDYRNSAFLIMQEIINNILTQDGSLLEIEKIELNRAELEPRGQDCQLYRTGYKVWYKRCAEYNKCQNLGY